MSVASKSAIGQGPFAMLLVDRPTAHTAIITLTLELGYTALGDDVLALNVNGAVTVSELPPTITSISAGKVDSFGSFNLVLNNAGDAASGFMFGNPLTFNLNLTSGAWMSAADVLFTNENGYLAACHLLRQGSSRTGFAAVMPSLEEPDATVAPFTLMPAKLAPQMR